MPAQHKRPGRTAKLERQRRAQAKRDRCIVIELWPAVRDHRPGRVVIAAEWKNKLVQ